MTNSHNDKIPLLINQLDQFQEILKRSPHFVKEHQLHGQDKLDLKEVGALRNKLSDLISKKNAVENDVIEAEKKILNIMSCLFDAISFAIEHELKSHHSYENLKREFHELKKYYALLTTTTVVSVTLWTKDKSDHYFVSCFLKLAEKINICLVGQEKQAKFYKQLEEKTWGNKICEIENSLGKGERALIDEQQIQSLRKLLVERLALESANHEQELLHRLTHFLNTSFVQLAMINSTTLQYVHQYGKT